MTTAPSLRLQVLGFAFETPESQTQHEHFMSIYTSVLVRRSMRWSLSFPVGERLPHTRKLKRFCRKGIPNDRRAEVWMEISGANAKMRINQGLYKRLLEEGRKKYHATDMEQIELDLPRTFPDNLYFTGKDTGATQIGILRNILCAFAALRPDIGYTQGMGFVAGICILVMKKEETAFFLFATIMEKLPNYYGHGFEAYKVDFRVLRDLLRQRQPHLAEIIEKSQIPLETIAVKWFLNLFFDVVPIETMLRIWDCLLLEGDKILFRASLAMLEMHAVDVVAARQMGEHEALMATKNMGKEVFDCHAFMRHCFLIRPLSRNMLRTARAAKYAAMRAGDES
eukprot:m.43007 g.43007  ORF g.43007 m.43007 type:complete len:339 (-) comp12166_c0_seq1:235-1251(-)